MKRFTKYLALFLTGSLAALTACGPEMNEVEVRNTPVINSSTLSPLTDESGSVRAYVGTEVSAEGFNLDRVSHVTLGDLEAEITEQTIKTLKFKVPALEFAQQDAPYQVWLDVYDADGESVIFHYPYYVTVPVTDALITAYAPAEGTIGTEITLTGRNLEQITRVHFGESTVEAADFTGQTAEAVKFAVPAGTYAAGDSQVAISAEWGTATIDVTGETLFTMHTPKFDAVSQEEGKNSLIGDEVTFSGQNLDLVSGMKWGDYDLIVLSSEAGAVTVKFPSSIEKTDPVVAEAALTALWGEPVQTAPVASTWRVDTTPVGPAKPVLVKMEAEDGGADNKFYLGKTVTVTGENMASIEGFTIDGVEAALVGEPTDVSAQFIVPEGVTFTEATEVAVKAFYNGGNEVDFGTAKVYPFYYYPNIQMGIGSNSKSTYPDYNREHAFLLLNSGEVISGDSWYNDSIDPYAKGGSNSLIASAGKLSGTATAEQYYGVQPYLFFSASSSHKLALQSPANSSSQLKTHCYLDEGKNTSLPSAFGTPIFYFRVLLAEDDQLKGTIVDGSVTSMFDYTTVGSSAAPAFGTAEASNIWIPGSVIVVQYINHAHGLLGDKPESMDDICRQGFLYVREVNCADAATGLANADRAGYIEFDMYWSKPLNE